jgi:hypothetical protein
MREHNTSLKRKKNQRSDLELTNAEPAWAAKARASVISVGSKGGRGFVVETSQEKRLVITAAHCLSQWVIPAHGMSYTEERTRHKLLGPIGKRRKVSAECLFIDPIADIAVLGSPDDQAFFTEAAAYEALMESMTPIPIAESLKNVDAGFWVWTAFGLHAQPTVQPSLAVRSGYPLRRNRSLVVCQARRLFRIMGMR